VSCLHKACPDSLPSRRLHRCAAPAARARQGVEPVHARVREGPGPGLPRARHRLPGVQARAGGPGELPERRPAVGRLRHRGATLSSATDRVTPCRGCAAHAVHACWLGSASARACLRVPDESVGAQPAGPRDADGEAVGREPGRQGLPAPLALVPGRDRCDGARARARARRGCPGPGRWCGTQWVGRSAACGAPVFDLGHIAGMPRACPMQVSRILEECQVSSWD